MTSPSTPCCAEQQLLIYTARVSQKHTLPHDHASFRWHICPAKRVPESHALVRNLHPRGESQSGWIRTLLCGLRFFLYSRTCSNPTTLVPVSCSSNPTRCCQRKRKNKGKKTVPLGLTSILILIFEKKPVRGRVETICTYSMCSTPV